MTRLRLLAADTIGAILVLIGICGFAVSAVINLSAQQRLLATDRFDHPTATTPAAIELKGRTFFVETNYARRFRLADGLLFPFWCIIALGGCLQNRKKIAAQLKRSGLFKRP